MAREYELVAVQSLVELRCLNRASNDWEWRHDKSQHGREDAHVADDDWLEIASQY